MINLIVLIILLFFNAFFYILSGVDNTSSVWLSYSFIHIAALMVFVNSGLCKNFKNKVPNLIASLNTISLGLFIIEFIVGGVFCIIGIEGYKLTLIIHLLIFAIFLLFYLPMFVGTYKIVKNE